MLPKVDRQSGSGRHEGFWSSDETSVNYIKLMARADGSFTVMNSRNGFHKEYAAHK